MEDGNALRKEIKAVANEYDVEWDELKEEKDQNVSDALRKDRKQKNKSDKKSEDKDDDSDSGDSKRSESKS